MKEIIEIMESDLSDTAKEAYNSLRANIQFYSKSKKIKTLAITSFNKGEGKTTTSINLAISMAKIGMNVLYIDADLRKTSLLKNSNENNLGLSNILLSQITMEDAVNRTNIRSLNYITSGGLTLYAGELISSNKFSQFLQEVKVQYDLIIIDTPPLGKVIDGVVIAAQTDGTVIVIASNTTKTHHTAMMKEQLSKANANIVGVVLNKIPKESYKYYYGK